MSSCTSSYSPHLPGCSLPSLGVDAYCDLVYYNLKALNFVSAWTWPPNPKSEFVSRTPETETTFLCLPFHSEVYIRELYFPYIYF